MVKKIFVKTVPSTITIIRGKMSGDHEDEDMSSHGSENESKSDNDSDDFRKMNDPEACPTQTDYDRFKKQWNEERKKLKAVSEKLENGKNKRSATKKIICIKNYRHQ